MMAPIAVSNTSPLIFLAKVPELIPLLRKKYSYIIIPKEVYTEAAEKGLQSHNPEISANAARIKALVDEKFIRVASAKKGKLYKSLSSYLGNGEAAAISLAIERKVKDVLIDEKPATSVARSLGLIPSPVSLLPVEAFHRGAMSKDGAVKLLGKLLANNYYLSSKDYNAIMEMLENEE